MNYGLECILQPVVILLEKSEKSGKTAFFHFFRFLSKNVLFIFFCKKKKFLQKKNFLQKKKFF